MTDSAAMQAKPMSEQHKAEQALMLLGYVKVKEGVWKHPYFTKSQKIDTQDSGSVVLSLRRIYKEWGARDAKAEIRKALGVDE